MDDDVSLDNAENVLLQQTIALANGQLSVDIAAQGAELASLRDASGREFLWNGDPHWWPGRAPLLFPMVGRAAADHIRIADRYYPLPQHGFARRRRFEIITASSARCLLRLCADDETRAAFPFSFRLDASYELRESKLAITAAVMNDGDVPLPCAFGFHPAFRWPLPGSDGAHEVAFEQEETAPIRLLADGLLAAEEIPNPIEARRLRLSPALFERGALIFDRLASRRVVYGAPGGPSIAVSFPDMPHFGLWTKPGAPFLCLEPWQGFAAPVGFDGEFADRPGIVSIAPKGSRIFAMDVVVESAA